MKYSTAFFAAMIGSFAIVGTATAEGYQAQVDKCIQQYANERDAAAITLECNAAGGKLSDCKVVESTTTLKGFEKAALCVAEFLPVGSKTGTIKVPVRFPGAKG